MGTNMSTMGTNKKMFAPRFSSRTSPAIYPHYLHYIVRENFIKRFIPQLVQIIFI